MVRIAGWWILLPDDVAGDEPRAGTWIAERRLVGGLDGLPVDEAGALALGPRIATWIGRTVHLVEATTGRQVRLLHVGRVCGPGLPGAQQPLPPGIAVLLERRGFPRSELGDVMFRQRLAVVTCYTVPGTTCARRRSGYCDTCGWTFLRNR